MGDYFTLHDFLNLPFYVAFDIFRFPWRLFSVRSIRYFVRFAQLHVKDRVNFPAWRDIKFQISLVSFFEHFEWSI